MMKKKLIVVGIIIIVVSAASTVAFKVHNARSEKKADRIEVVRRGPLVVRLKERGNLDSLVKVEVRSNVEGIIEKLYVDEGYDVVKGQELLKIDEKQIREEYNQAKANYDAAKAELDRSMENATLSIEKLKSDILLADANLSSSRANLADIKARAVQQTLSAQTSIANLESLLEQDMIALKKAQLALTQAESNEKSAKAKLDNAKAELDRKRELYEKKFVPLREVENAQLEYASAKFQHESAENEIQAQRENIQSQQKIIENRKASLQSERANLETLRQSLAEQERQAEIQVQQAKEKLELLRKNEEREKQILQLAKKSAEANLELAKSALNKAKERLEWTTVVAPMSGRIIQCGVEEGEIITSGRSAWSQGPPVMVIADLSKMIVKTQVHEIDISKVKVGQKAEIRVDSYPDDVFEGEVKEISPSAQFVENTIRFEVTVAITKAPKPLLPGMTAYVDIIVGERDNVLQLPLEAVTTKETIKVETDIKKDLLSKLKGQKVDVVINSYPDKKFAGRTVEFAPERQGLFSSKVTIIMEGTPKELQPGTTHTGDIILPNGDKIPNVEVRIGSEERHYVKLVKGTVGEGDKTKIEEEERMVKVGDRTQSSVEILDGLKEGDRVRVVPIGEEEAKKEKKS